MKFAFMQKGRMKFKAIGHDQNIKACIVHRGRNIGILTCLRYIPSRVGK